MCPLGIFCMPAFFISRNLVTYLVIFYSLNCSDDILDPVIDTRKIWSGNDCVLRLGILF